MSRKAFTLIELLVVVAIIAILAAVLFPVFARAQATAKGTVCLSNCRQMGVAAALYLNDNDDTFPLDSHSGMGSSWYTTLTQYSRTRLVWRCPVDLSANWERPIGNSTKARLASFGTNYYFTPFDPVYPNASGYNNASRVAAPAQAVYIAELARNSVQEHFHPAFWYLKNVATPQQELQRTLHTDQAHYVFVDGHARRAAFSVLFSGDHVVDQFDPSRE